jgi:hypothetical protein
MLYTWLFLPSLSLNPFNQDNGSDPELDMDSDHSGAEPVDLLDFDDDTLLTLLSHDLLEAFAGIYSNHYHEERRVIPKSRAQLYLLLTEWKESQPSIFRSYLRMTPKCFDKLVETLSPHPAFQNELSNVQMPVEQQLAIALYWFGHYGNAASTMNSVLRFGPVRSFCHFEGNWQLQQKVGNCNWTAKNQSFAVLCLVATRCNRSFNPNQ